MQQTQPWPLPHLERVRLQVHWQVSKLRYQLILPQPRRIPAWNTTTIFKSKSQPKRWAAESYPPVCSSAGMEGWVRRGEKPSCSYSRSRASTLRLLFLPSSFCWGMLRRSRFTLSLTLPHWFRFLSLFSQPFSITHSCLSLSLLLSPPSPSLSQRAHSLSPPSTLTA